MPGRPQAVKSRVPLASHQATEKGLVNGTLLFTAWGRPGIVGLFASLFGYSAAFSYAFRWLGARTARAVVAVAYLSVVVLAGFGIYVGITALTLLYPRAP